MKIVIDTEMKKTICPKAFFDNIRQINEASKLTGRTEDLEWKEYLKSILLTSLSRLSISNIGVNSFLFHIIINQFD